MPPHSSRFSNTSLSTTQSYLIRLFITILQIRFSNNSVLNLNSLGMRQVWSRDHFAKMIFMECVKSCNQCFNGDIFQLSSGPVEIIGRLTCAPQGAFNTDKALRAPGVNCYVNDFNRLLVYVIGPLITFHE